jgi:hypothetical protein
MTWIKVEPQSHHDGVKQVLKKLLSELNIIIVGQIVLVLFVVYLVMHWLGFFKKLRRKKKVRTSEKKVVGFTQ